MTDEAKAAYEKVQVAIRELGDVMQKEKPITDEELEEIALAVYEGIRDMGPWPEGVDGVQVYEHREMMEECA